MSQGVDAEPFLVVADGEPIPARPGQSVAAALIAAGLVSWRVTRGAAEPRGLFCGMGVCFDCLVTINGVRSVRACLTPAEPGDVIETERGTGHGDLTV